MKNLDIWKKTLKNSHKKREKKKKKKKNAKKEEDERFLDEVGATDEDRSAKPKEDLSEFMKGKDRITPLPSIG